MGEQQRDGLQPRKDIRTPESFRQEEIEDIIHIVDTGPRHEEDVYPENIDGIVQKGVALLRKNRKARLPLPASFSAAFKTLEDRFSFTHAIQCPVNSIVDFETLNTRLEQYMATHAVPLDNKDVKYMQSFLDRYFTTNKLLIELYASDIALRFGVAKADDRFFERQWPTIQALFPQVTIQTEHLLEQNSQLLEGNASLNEKFHAEVNILTSALSQPKEIIKDRLYDDVIVPFSRLAAWNFEGLNEAPLIKVVQRLTDTYGQ